MSEALNLTLHAIDPFQPFSVGPYRVMVLRAAHDSALAPLLYLIERGGRSLFYATDTGPLPEETWAALRQLGLAHLREVEDGPLPEETWAALRRWGGRLDLVIMDHTFGLAEATARHLNSAQFLVQMARLRDEKLLATAARLYAHHLAHHSNLPHDELARYAAERGYLVASDGLEVTV